MNVLRTTMAVFLAAAVAACSTPSAHERIQNAELAQLTPLKQTYSGIVTGFDFKGDTTLIVSIDINAYQGMDDDAIPPMKHAMLLQWKKAWISAHPHKSATLHLQAIDFIGRTLWENQASV